MIILTLTLCASINQCMDFDFEPEQPITYHQCQARAPIAAGFIMGQMSNLQGMYVQRIRCRDANASKA